jgi:hypothetical protein
MRITKRALNYSGLSLVVVGLTVSLVACSGSSSPSTTTSSTAATTTTTAPSTTTTAPSTSGASPSPPRAIAAAHTVGANCASCHVAEQMAWASPLDKHAASAADVLLNNEHNAGEGLPPANGNPANECLLCHSAFQAKSFTVGDFVQPVNVGTNNNGPSLPDGSWSLTPGASHWQATNCQVCHDPMANSPKRLAKYDGNTGTYQDVTGKTPVSHVLDLVAKTYTDVPVKAGLSAAATTLCDSCHDPEDQGADPAPAGSETYGPQGGDSRAYVSPSHQGLGCNDCHRGHDFQPADPSITLSCQGANCHDISQVGRGPGVVHLNHLPATGATTASAPTTSSTGSTATSSAK